MRRTPNGSRFGDVETASGMIKCLLPETAKTGDRVLIVVRPEDLNLMVGGAGGENVIEGRVAAAMFMGDSTEFRVALKDTALRLKLHPSTTVAEGQTIRIELPAERCRALMG